MINLSHLFECLELHFFQVLIPVTPSVHSFSQVLNDLCEVEEVEKSTINNTQMHILVNPFTNYTTPNDDSIPI